MYSSGNNNGPKGFFCGVFFPTPLLKLLISAYQIEIPLCGLSRLKLLIRVCNSLLVWLALNVVCDHMLHVYQCSSTLQSSVLAWGISWHKTVFLQLVQHAALLVICMARAYTCLGSAARSWFIACRFKYVFDLASKRLWSSKEVEDWGWEIKIAVNMGCVIP